MPASANDLLYRSSINVFSTPNSSIYFVAVIVSPGSADLKKDPSSFPALPKPSAFLNVFASKYSAPRSALLIIESLNELAICTPNPLLYF